MATAKTVKKTSPGKTATPLAVTGKAKQAKQAEPKAKPPAVKKAAPKAAPRGEVAPRARVRAPKPVAVSSEQRRNYIEVAAYHIAERRGFAPGDPFADWVQAEAEIDRLIAAGLLGA